MLQGEKAIDSQTSCWRICSCSRTQQGLLPGQSGNFQATFSNISSSCTQYFYLRLTYVLMKALTVQDLSRCLLIMVIQS